MKAITFDLINGICLGVEHVSGDEDDPFNWLVGIHLLLFRITILDLKPEEIEKE